MTGAEPSAARLLSRADFMRRAAAFLSALLHRPGSAFAFEGNRKDRRPPAGTKRNPVDAILFYGQSNAGAGGHARSILTSPVFSDRIFTFRTTQQSYGTKFLDPARLEGIGALHDDLKSAPYPATAMAYALGDQTSAHAYFMHTVWYGGQPLTSFLRGTTSWADLLAVAQRLGQVLAAKMLRGRIAALVLIQGEAGPPGRENYARLLQALLDQLLPSLKAQTGQSRPPVCMLLQTNASNAYPTSAVGVPLAQWDVARARPEDTVLVGPMYQFPLGDAVHQSAEGRMMLGDLLALVFEMRVLCDQPFEPLHPIVARLTDDAVVVSFRRPTGSLALQWDDAWVKPVPNCGFQVRCNTGPVSIAAVEITDQSEVTIRLAPNGSRQGLVVSYAMDQPHQDGWAPGRGQLIAPTKRRSAFATLAVRIPDTVSHYAIRFELPVG